MTLQRKRTLKNGGRIKSTSTIRPRSKKTIKLYETRSALRKDLFADNPLCERCHTVPACDIHEILSRGRGGSIIDVKNFALLCRPCHEFVTVNVVEAEAEGFLVSRYNK